MRQWISNRSFKHNASFVMTRWPTIRRHKSLRPPSPSPSLQAKESRGVNRPETEAAGGCQIPVVQGHTVPQPPRLQASTSQDSVGRDENSLHDMCEEEEGTVGGRWQELTPKHKAAIRAIRKVSTYLELHELYESTWKSRTHIWADLLNLIAPKNCSCEIKVVFVSQSAVF